MTSTGAPGEVSIVVFHDKKQQNLYEDHELLQNFWGTYYSISFMCDPSLAGSYLLLEQKIGHAETQHTKSILD